MADSMPAAARGGRPAPPDPSPMPGTWAQPRREPPLVRPLRPAAARRLLVSAALAGVAFQALFLGHLAGLNVPVWTAVLLLIGAVLAPRPWRITRADAWLPVGAMAFAVLVAIRATPALVAFDLAATAALTGATFAALGGARVTTRSLSGLTALVGQGMALTAAGSIGLGSARRGLRGGLDGATAARTRAVLVGFAAAVPIAVVFTVLFASADAVFQAAATDLLGIQLQVGDLPARALLAIAVAWGIGGLLVLAVAATARVRREPAPLGFTLGPIEATVVLAVVGAVFLAFAAIQAGYLFGGLDTVAATGLGHAQYARRGFFELVAVAGLAGMLIVGLESVVVDRRRSYRVAALVLVACTGVVLLSAAVRMSLYQDAFGWSSLRFFVVAAIGWLALCLVAAAACIATSRSRSLPAVAGVLGLVVALGVNVADPGAFVASRNLQRAADPGAVPEGGTAALDVAYLAGLGADAVPAIVRELPTLSPADQDRVRSMLLARRERLGLSVGPTGWPSWNLSRAAERDALLALSPVGPGQPASGASSP